MKPAEPLALSAILNFGELAAPTHAVSAIRVESAHVAMRDGARLATDLYLPPTPLAPTLVMRAPYGRASDKMVGAFLSFARRGYAIVSQDCRGTGDSEPDRWDYYMYETEDGYDLVDWITRQAWYDGFIGACGGSYVGQTQWCMALHPSMSAIAPEVSGLGVAPTQAHLYMYLNAYAHTVGKGPRKRAVSLRSLERNMLAATLAGGYFNEPISAAIPAPLRTLYPQLAQMAPQCARDWLWAQYCQLPARDRTQFIERALGTDGVSVVEIEALSSVFGPSRPHDGHIVPALDAAKTAQALKAPAFMITSWYDWALADALATWKTLEEHAPSHVRSHSRLLITPSAHNRPGYGIGMAHAPALQRVHRGENNTALLLAWYDSVRRGEEDQWPKVVYYLMGADAWCASESWPPREARELALYLAADGRLETEPSQSAPDTYIYDPADPTPTTGGSIVSYVFTPGSADIAEVQRRADVLTYTSKTLAADLDIVGPMRMTLFARSSAPDTDFFARISDVFPDGRAIQLQSGLVRARFRALDQPPSLLAPGKVYQFDIDMAATANRFCRGHSIRIDISSADFPKYDRNANLGGGEGDPDTAAQTIFHDLEHPSHVVLMVLGKGPDFACEQTCQERSS